MEQKVQISQDTLYKFILERNIKLVRIAELIDLSEGSVNSCFKHQVINNSKPRSFTRKTIARINEALPLLAEMLRQRVLKFDDERARTNQLGNTYDLGLVEPMKRIGEILNITAFANRVLGWSQSTKENILVTESSKAYGNISKANADAVNTELLAMAGVLSNWEVVADKDLNSTDDNSQETNSKRKTKKGRSDTWLHEWDDVSLSLPERSALLRQQWANGVLLFRVNDGYTVEGDDAQMAHDLLPDVQPYTDTTTGLTTAWMNNDQMGQVLARLIAQGRRVVITNMYKE